MMRGLKIIQWPWPLIILLLSLSSSCCHLSQARHHHQKLPLAVVVGTVYCDTCFFDFSKGTHFISGATVTVECEEGKSRPAFYEEVKTDKQGNFKVNLPFSVSKHVKEIEGCTMKLVKSSEPYCAVASTATSSAIHFKEKKGGKHIFSAGFFTFKPLKQPGLCNQQPSVTKSNLNTLNGLFLPNNPEIPTLPTPNPISNPLSPTGPNLPFIPPFLPPLPPLPSLPPLPELPRLPGFPSFPSKMVPHKPIGTSEEARVENGEISQPQFFFFPPIFPSPPSVIPLPPNPLQPPPLLPNPFQPPSPPLIPNPFQPPPTPPTLLPPLPQLPPYPNLPPVSSLTPTPSPPPPSSAFPFPIPRIPFPSGLPFIPGIPPASVNSKKVTP